MVKGWVNDDNRCWTSVIIAVLSQIFIKVQIDACKLRKSKDAPVLVLKSTVGGSLSCP